MGSSFHIEHFGCRAARADGEAIADRLRAAGLSERLPAQADVVVVNTCSVTAEADRAARAFIRRAHRLNPEARIVATGCYAQRVPHELAALDGVAAVVGNSHKAFAPEIALSLAQGRNPSIVNPAFKPAEDDRALKGHGFSRAANVTELPRASVPEGRFAPEDPYPAPAPPLVSIQSLLSNSGPGSQPLVLADDHFAHSFLEEAQLVPGAQTRPNLKIQEGCGNRCTFCVIPQTRGSSRSLPAATILSQVRGFVAAGGNELVLSGINLGRWGRDLGLEGNHESVKSPDSVKGTGFSPYIDAANCIGALAPDGYSPRTLSGFVRQILQQTGLPRLRLSSIEPMDWDHDLIALMAEFGGTRAGSPATGLRRWGDNRLARHAHLPLQSGSDAVLRRMHRRYRPWHYAEKVAALIRAAGPDLTLGADVMAGFPGETDREFEETMDLIRALPFGYLHLFPFSPRPGTRAWALHAEAPVPPAVVEERMTALRSLAAEKTQTHRSRFLGRELDAITLHSPAHIGRGAALTENFLPVELAVPLPANLLVRVRVTGFSPQGSLLATAVPQPPAFPALSAVL